MSLKSDLIKKSKSDGFNPKKSKPIDDDMPTLISEDEEGLVIENVPKSKAQQQQPQITMPEIDFGDDIEDDLDIDNFIENITLDDIIGDDDGEDSVEDDNFFPEPVPTVPEQQFYQAPPVQQVPRQQVQQSRHYSQPDVYQPQDNYNEQQNWCYDEVVQEPVPMQQQYSYQQQPSSPNPIQQQRPPKQQKKQQSPQMKRKTQMRDAQDEYERVYQNAPVQQYDDNEFEDPYDMSDPIIDSSSVNMSSEDVKLGEDLLNLSKRVILLDICNTDNFTSQIVTKEALQKLINAYLSGDDSKYPFSNSKAVLSSVIDEICDSDYKHDHYDKLTNSVLVSVKNDLSF